MVSVLKYLVRGRPAGVGAFLGRFLGKVGEPQAGGFPIPHLLGEVPEVLVGDLGGCLEVLVDDLVQGLA